MIPAGWKVRKLGELLDVQNGFAFSSEYFSESRGIPLIRIRDLKNGIATATRYTGPFDKSYVVREGDFLIGMDGEFRCYHWRGEAALLNQRVCRLVDFSNEVNPDFVRFGLNNYLAEIEALTPYVTVRHLSSKSILNINFSYPIRSEQDRIVARIKESMEKIEEIESLRKQASLEAEAVLPSILNDVFTIQSSSAPQYTIGDVAIETRYGTSQKCHSDPVGTPILRIPNVAQGAVNFDELKFCVLERTDLNRVRLQEGDLLFVRTNGSRDLVGRCAVYAGDNQGRSFGFASYLIRVRVDQRKVIPRYLAYFLKSTNGRAEIDVRRRTSAGQFNINSDNLRSIAFPVPSLSEQASLLRDLEQREALANQLAVELRSSISDGAALRESILRKAFAGEL